METKAPTDVHKHRCGLSEVAELAAIGCGFEWEHERIFKNSADYSRRHMCPNCGAGPWYTRVLSAEQERLHAALETTMRDPLTPQLIERAEKLLDTIGFRRASVITLTVIEFDAEALRRFR